MKSCLKQNSWRRIPAVLLWFAAGLIFLAVDESFQPYLTAFGRNPSVKKVALVWQELGATAGIVLFVVAGLLLMIRDRGATLARFVASISLAGVAVQLLKHLFGRVRPALSQDTTHFYGPFGVLHDGPWTRFDSMPSGHTATAFAMAVALGLRWPRTSPLWFLLATGVGISRTLVDSHFPSDVVFGALLGSLASCMVEYWMARRMPASHQAAS
jgi:membrane-associated phospholipid phosphatase